MALNTNLVPSESLLLALISEELKSRKFFGTLQQLGLDNAYYQPHLDAVIMQGLGLSEESNETLDFYYAVMEEHAGKIGIKQESVTEQAEVVLAKLKRIAGS
jgi:hypothetical protein